MLLPTDWLSYGVVLSQMLSLAAAVDLNLYYAEYTCRGNKAVCTNVGPRLCCLPRLWWKEDYYAASCYNCNSGMVHVAWSGRPGKVCNEKKAYEKRGGNNNCISQAGMNPIKALYGQTWNYIGKRKRDDGSYDEDFEEDSEQCLGTVEPDLLEIDGRFFGVNETVPEAEKLELYTLMGSGASLDDVPKGLRIYESNYEVEE